MVFFAFLLVLKLSDILFPIRDSTFRIGIATCVFGLAIYVCCHLVRKPSLQETAALIDHKAGLRDEMKTALWFIRNPKPSQWIEAQIGRAASTTATLDVKGLYPRSIPNTFYVAGLLFACFLGLNFLPYSWNHNRLTTASSAIANTSMAQDAERLLQKAKTFGNAGLAEQLAQIIQQIQRGKLGSTEAAALLRAFEKELDETAERMSRLEEQMDLEAQQSQKEALSAIGELASDSRRELDNTDGEDFNSDSAEAVRLRIKLEQQKLDGAVDEDVKAEDLEPSKWTRSKLSYRSIRSDITSGRQDLLERDRIPREYRSVVKQYFEAINPEKN